MAVVLAVVATACSENEGKTQADLDHEAHRHDTSLEALFVNPGFETGNLSGWTVSVGRGHSSGPLLPVLSEADLRITWGSGSNLTSAKNGAPFTLVPPGLSTGDIARYPRYGNWAAVVNELGTNINANRITQESEVVPADVDPVDGLVHVRFTLLPVLQNPGHSVSQQPYYYVAITNETKGTVLASRFNFSNEAGVPWQSTSSGSVVYTDWLLFDLPLSRDQVSIGDRLKATVIATGCSPTAHWGYAIVDSFGSSIPGLAVYGSGPDSVEAGTDYQYVYRVLNGGQQTNTGVKLTVYLPAGTSFRSVDTPGVSCSRPSVGTRGTVTCELGALAPGGSSPLRLTVRADATATGEIRHGWYQVQSNEERALTGNLVVTRVTTGGTTQYVDLVTSIDNAATSLAWGQAATWSVTVRNDGPATATGARIVTNAPALLTGLAWTCTPLGGASCGASSGTGPLDTTATLPAGGSVTYAIDATVVSGTGSAVLSFTARADAPTGTVDRLAANNGAGDDDTVNTAVATVTLVRAGAGSGALVSSPAGLSCGAACAQTTGSFAVGSVVAFQAVPAAGSVFAGWSGACTGTGACSLTLGGSATVTGTFAPNPVAITSPLTANAAVGRPFSYTVTALGEAPLTLSAAGLPAWLSFDAETGVLSGTAPAAGTFSLTLTAANAGASDVKTLVVTAGVAPAITSTLTWTRAAASTAWNTSPAITVTATGTGPIQYNASSLPGTVYFNSTTGTFAGNAGANGVFNVPVVATNAFGSDYKVLAVSVGGAPVITSALTAKGTVGTAFSYTLTATGNATLVLSVSDLPAWASFNPTSGVISGTPTAAGTFAIGLRAQNSVGQSQQTLALTVDGPAIITSALTAQGVAEQPFSYSMTAEGTAPIASAMSQLPAWASFDTASGLLSGTPPGPGTFTVQMAATNGVGSDAKALVITIAAPPPTPTPPVLNSAATASGLVGGAFAYTITASGQVPMTFSASGLPAWATLDAATGAITGAPAAEGSFTVTLGATNALGSDSKALVISVATPPAITSGLTASAVVGQPFAYALAATGTAPLALSASGLPAWASFDAATGVLSGTPTADGTFTIGLGASNAVGTDTEALTLTVRSLPAITSALTADAVAGEAFSYALTASGTAPLTFTAGSLPAWASFDAASGVLSGTPEAEGTATLSLAVSNAAGSDAKTLVVTVREVPVITSPADADAVVGVPFSYTLTARGTGPLTKSTGSLPAWATFDAATGVISGTPAAEGSVSIALGVMNAVGSHAKMLSLAVRSRPVLTSALSADAVVGVPFSYTLTATGTPPRTFAAANLPSWASFDAATGVLSGTPDAEGPAAVTLTVSNPAASDTKTLALTVRARPALTSALTADAVVGLPFSYLVEATGTAPVTFSATNLPGWASFDAAAGRLLGTPDADGDSSISLGASNAAGADAKSLVITARTRPAITSSGSADAVVGVPFTFQVKASGTAPLALSATDLPGWAGFDAATGLLSGTPDADGTHHVRLDVSNAAGHAVDDLLVTVRSPVAITSTLEAEAVVGVPFSYRLTASGTAPITLSASGLPAWAGFDATTGVLSGTPDVEGELLLSLSASNVPGLDSRTLRLVVRAVPAITSALEVSAVVGVPLTYLPSAAGTGPITFAFGALPAWAHVDAASGALVGVPTADGAFTAYLLATNAAGQDAKVLHLTARTAPRVVAVPMAVGAVGLPLELEVGVTGTQPIALTAAGLPAGLVLSGNQVLGVPTVAGVFTVTLRAENLAGADEHTLTLALRPGLPVPVILAPAREAILPTGAPTIAGSAPASEAGNQVVVQEGGRLLCTGVVQASGVWACSASGLAEGLHFVTAHLLDQSGLVGGQSAPWPFVVDLTAPEAPTWSGPLPASPVSHSQPMLWGSGEPGATAFVTHQGTPVCSATVSSVGTWACSPTAPLPEGAVSLSVTQRDAAGHESAPTPHAFVIDTIAPPPVALTAPAHGELLATRTPTIRGAAEAGSTVEVYVDGVRVCTVLADETGRFACTPPAPLADGMRAITATATDAAGNTSAPAMAVVQVDTRAPAAPSLTSPVADGPYVRTATPVFAGTAEPRATVSVQVGGALVCVTTADAHGRWSCPATSPLADGPHAYAVTARDAAGNESPALTGVIDVQTARGNVAAPREGVASTNSTLTGTGTPGATVNVYIDGQLVGTATVGDDGAWAYQLPVLPAGEHEVTVGFTNAAGDEVYRAAPAKHVVRAPNADLGGGLGCSQTSGGPAWALALLGGLALLRRRAVKAAAPVAAAAVVLGGAAQAQVAVSGFDLSQFTLQPAARGGLAVDGNALLAPGDFRLGAALGYENSPLVYFEDGVRRAALVEHRWTAALSGAWAPTPWLELGATLPVVLHQSGATVRSAAGEAVITPVARGASVGTPWLQARVGVLREAAGHPLDLGLTVALGIPAGVSPHLSRDEAVSGQVVLGVGRTVGALRFAAEAGALLRRDTPLLSGFAASGGETVGSRLQFGLGASTLGAGLRGELSVRTFVSLTQQPVAAEVLGGVRYPLGDFELFALAGPGFGNAPGTPAVRAVVGAAFGGRRDPRCAAGGVDARAQCPELDFDGDGLRNRDDACPTVAAAGRADGCPLRDADGDGVEDALDACPATAGLAAHGGCPAPAAPPAPVAPAVEEAAPAEEEAPQVTLESGRFELSGKVYFDTAKATLQPRSFALLDEVAEVMKAHPEVQRVSIDGHTDGRGDAAFNQQLSLERARAVRDYLVGQGVEAGRLEARGFGPGRPVAGDDTAEGREQNRRVEFIVVE